MLKVQDLQGDQSITCEHGFQHTFGRMPAVQPDHNTARTVGPVAGAREFWRARTVAPTHDGVIPLYDPIGLSD